MTCIVVYFYLIHLLQSYYPIPTKPLPLPNFSPSTLISVFKQLCVCVCLSGVYVWCMCIY